jgi:hypothetical protein
MIYETLQILKEQLENYFDEVGLSKNLILDNIALFESGSVQAESLDGKVVMSLINLEEETTLKNYPSAKVRDDKTEFTNPPVNLNLYIIISGNCTSYDISLKSISKTIEFFQGKKVFTSANTVFNRTDVSMDVLDHFKFILELYTPSFEELNYIWGTMGGRQLPSVIYKIQLIKIDQEKLRATSPVISTIGGNLKGNQ